MKPDDLLLLNRYILVREEVPATRTAGGLYLPETAKDHHTVAKGVIVRAAADAFEELAMNDRQARTILYERLGSVTIELSGEKYSLIKPQDIIAWVGV